jgi:hypothetical protein
MMLLVIKRWGAVGCAVLGQVVLAKPALERGAMDEHLKCFFGGKLPVLIAHLYCYASLKFKLLILDLTIERHIKWKSGGRG